MRRREFVAQQQLENVEVHDVNRRNFVAWIVGTALLFPVASQSQQAVRVIGFLNPGSSEGLDEFIEAYRQGLGEVGYAEGKNVKIEIRSGNDRTDLLAGLVADFVKRKVDVLATAGASAA